MIFLTYFWEDFDQTRVFSQLILMSICLLSFLRLGILDLKYKEMYYYQEFIPNCLFCSLSLLGLYLYGNHSLLYYLIPCMLIWGFFTMFNLKHNPDKREKTVIENGEKVKKELPPILGAADIDCFSLQLITSIGYILWVYFNHDSQLKMFLIFDIGRKMFNSFFYGLLFVTILSLFNILIKYIKNGKQDFKRIYKNEKIPMLVAVIPCVVSNMFLIFSTL